jgi:four helix bundle protein
VLKTDLKKRTRDYAIRIIKVCKSLDKNEWIAVVLGKQLLRSGTSSAANYRATIIAKSDKDFLNKLKIVEEELDESLFWMEMLVESGVFPKKKLELLLQEGSELLRIISASVITMKSKRKIQKKANKQ